MTGDERKRSGNIDVQTVLIGEQHILSITFDDLKVIHTFVLDVCCFHGSPLTDQK